jgi:hypothetical protein
MSTTNLANLATNLAVTCSDQNRSVQFGVNTAKLTLEPRFLTLYPQRLNRFAPNSRSGIFIVQTQF